MTALSKVQFGNNIPGWATGVSKNAAVIVLQVFLEHIVLEPNYGHADMHLTSAEHGQ